LIWINRALIIYYNITKEVEIVIGIVMLIRPLMPKAQLIAEKLVVGVAINIYV
jgi:hypothetical protein